MSLEQYFEPQKYESEIYRMWEESGAFRADADSGKPPFTISMPPPNATGTLHLGHAVMLAIEDLLIRWRRMAGDEALWVPGTDHAAIATERPARPGPTRMILMAADYGSGGGRR